MYLDNPNLAADPDACWVVKDELVEVEFAARAGDLASAVGMNHFETGDALVTGSTGDRWCVSRARFDAKYEPEPSTLPGQNGSYRNRPVAVLAKRLTAPF